MEEQAFFQYLLDNSDKIKQAFFGEEKSDISRDISYGFDTPVTLPRAGHLRRISTTFVPVRNITRLCYHCGGRDMYDDIEHGDLVCVSCGTCTNNALIDDAYRCMSYHDYGELVYRNGGHRRKSCYKKSDYLTRILVSVNGMNVSDIPDEVFRVVREHLGHRDFVKVTDVRRVLKNAGMSRFYSRASYIACSINSDCGHERPPPLDHHQESAVRSLFNRYCFVLSRDLRGRKNSLSYPYVVYQLLRIINREDLCVNVKLLKCKKRLTYHDERWKDICMASGWPFFPVRAI